MQSIYLTIPLACLAGAIVAGLFGGKIGRTGAHSAAIGGVAVAFVLSVVVFLDVLDGNRFNGAVYTWAWGEDGSAGIIPPYKKGRSEWLEAIKEDRHGTD